MRKLAFAITVFLLAMLGASLVCGCGGESPRLTFNSDEDTPVIIYSSYKAIAPVYNSSVPVTVIYPAKVIQKREPYELESASLTSEQVSDTLKKLEEQGYFTLKKEYHRAEQIAGGTTEKLSVRLKSGTYMVSVEGGAGPSGWDDIVATVTNVKASNYRVYVPLSLTLHAREVEGTEAAAGTKPWPGDPADLAKAAATTGGKAGGLELDGDWAATAWEAVSSSFSRGDAGEDTLWSAGGRFYRYVYAVPVLPGVKPGS